MLFTDGTLGRRRPSGLYFMLYLLEAWNGVSQAYVKQSQFYILDDSSD